MNPNEQIIYSTVTGAGYTPTLANIIISQAKFETGDFTNTAFTKYKNAFGYKYVPGARYQSGKGNESSEGDYYAAYDSLENSTKEIIAWLQRRQNEGKLTISLLTTPEAYAAALKSCGYFGGTLSAYINGLKHYLSMIIETVKKKPLQTALLITFGLFILYYLKK